MRSLHAFGTRLAAQNAQGHQQLTEARQRHQQIIREDLDVATHIAHALQQGERIDRTERMIGHNHTAPVLGNAFALDVVD